MNNPTANAQATTVGLDVHKASIRLAAVADGAILHEQTIPHDLAIVDTVLARFPAARCCYEAGPTGFGLYRHLTERGIDCDVVAPGLVPSKPGDRVKTDARDARKLALLHENGLLTAIEVPDPELEALRDLVRAREAARIDRMRDRHRLSKFCLRQSREMPGKSWGVARRGWLAQQHFPFATQQCAFDLYLHALDLVDRRIAALDARIQEAADQDRFRELVGRLRCLRGVDTLTAIGLVAEVGDFSRFERAEQFMAFVGLVPAEHSSGEQRRRGSITKAGNAHVRRLLIESAWHARRRPMVSYELQRRQRDQSAATIEHAYRCQARLHKRFSRMAARGKPQQKIVVACARELAGFVWAIATEQPLVTVN